MRKIYALLLFSIISGTLHAQLVNLNGNSQIYTSAGSTFRINGDIHINGTSSFTNNGQFESTGQLELNNTSTFINTSTGNTDISSLNLNSGTLTNQSNGVFDVANNADLNGGTITNATNGAFTVGATTTMGVSTLTNTGIFRSNILNILAAASFQNDNGRLQIENTLTPTNAANLDTDLGALEFVGNDATKRLDIDGAIPLLQVQDLTFNTGIPSNTIILESRVHVSGTADFNSGRVRYNVANDSLVILAAGDVTSNFVTGNGYMLSPLYRFPAFSGDSLLFPVGDNTGRFRPLWINSAQYPGFAPKIKVEYIGANTVTNNQLGYSSTFNQNSWGLKILSDSLAPSIVEVQFANGEGGPDLTQSVVAEGFSITPGDTIFYNLGNGGSTTISANSRVKSLLPAQGNSVLVIGQSTDLKLSINAILEGAWTSGIFMDTSLYEIGQLQSRFEFNSSGTTSENINNMMPNKPVPGSGTVFAIDSIILILRDAGNTGSIDTAVAWLMSDGSIRDYLTGQLPYAIFNNANISTPYLVLLEHRNHLRVRSVGTVTFNNNVNPEFYDFTDPVNIFGGGGVKMIGPNKVRIVGGNAFQDDVVNAIDYFQVGASNNNNDSGYLRTNVLFNSNNGPNVDAADLTKVQDNSTVLYFSTWQ